MCVRCVCMTLHLQVDAKELERNLTQRSLMTTRESVTKPLTSAQAVDGRDAFVKVTKSHFDKFKCI